MTEDTKDTKQNATPEDIAAGIEIAEERKSSRRKRGCLGCLGAIAVVFVLGMIGSNLDNNSNTNSSTTNTQSSISPQTQAPATNQSSTPEVKETEPVAQTREIEYKVVKFWVDETFSGDKLIDEVDEIPAEYLNHADLKALGEKLKRDNSVHDFVMANVTTDPSIVDLYHGYKNAELDEEELEFYESKLVAIYHKNNLTKTHSFTYYLDGETTVIDYTEGQNE